MLEDRLINPRIGKEDCMMVASKELKGMLKASTEEDDIFSFQTNCLFEYLENA
jgi:hypothetical protein